MDRLDFQLRLKPLYLSLEPRTHYASRLGGVAAHPPCCSYHDCQCVRGGEKAHTPSLLAHRSFLSPQGNGRPRNARGINERLAGGKERRKKSGHFRLHAEQRRARALAVISIFPAPFPIFLGTTPLGVHFSPSFSICCPPLGISSHEQKFIAQFFSPDFSSFFPSCPLRLDF